MRRRDFLVGLLSLPVALRALPQLDAPGTTAEPRAPARLAGPPARLSEIVLPGGVVVCLGDWVEDRLYGTEEYGSRDMLEAFSSGRAHKMA